MSGFCADILLKKGMSIRFYDYTVSPCSLLNQAAKSVKECLQRQKQILLKMDEITKRFFGCFKPIALV